MRRLVVLTGAGMSAESGVSTFRDSGGLWEGHDVMEVASPSGFRNDPELVLDFYNQRRRQLKEVEPNLGHLNIAKLEEDFDVCVVTQNVDDLHERAGSSNIVHLHGELRKVRSTVFPELIYSWEEDLILGDLCEKGAQLRPHIVWFGESVPMIEKAVEIVEKADVLVIIGTSMQVYPAASLVDFVDTSVPIYFIDPRPNFNPNYYDNDITIIAETAVNGTQKLLKMLSD